jgi:general secretion pathway protein A
LTLSDPLGVARGYEQYFGLVESPFGLTPNRRFLFESESHSAAVVQITLAIRRREPLMVITGEIGTGKSLLCRTIQPVEPRTFVSVISNPRLSPRELLRQVRHDVGLTAEQPTGADAPRDHDTGDTLQEFLASLAALSAHAVIVIDDAQKLAAATLEQVRLLCSLEAGQQDLLQVILVGRDDLDATLERPELRQLAERISRRHQLLPLKPHEITRYVEHRLAVAQGPPGPAGAQPDAGVVAIERFRRVRFTPVALRSLPALTQGVPRAVNVICDRALEIAHGQKKRVVDAGCVIAAARHLKVVVPFDRQRRSRWRFETVASVLIFACAAIFVLRVSGALSWAFGTAEPSIARTDIARSAIIDEPATIAPLPEAESYSVATAAFRSEARASEVAASLRLLDLPVSVRPVNGSHAVVIGPFASREEAVVAQAQIAKLHLTNSRIVSTAPTEGAIVHPLRPVATTGQKGQP